MSTAGATWQIDGRDVRVTSLGRRYWPDEGITKGDLLAYYRAIAPVMLPHIAERPMTLRVFPRGITGPGYYRRDRPDTAPAWIRSSRYQPETSVETLDAVLIDDVGGLVWLANTGSIEFHAWTARLPDLAVPDQAVFDLDPGQQLAFDAVLRAALGLREALEKRGLRGYPKTSGGSGLHVYIPLTPSHT